MSDAPRYDGRSEAEIIEATETLASAWTGWRPTPADDLDLGGAMVRLFARMVDHAIDHVDRAPLEHAAELFRLLGVRTQPPTVGRAPLVFTPVDGAPTDPVVPLGTAVEAPADDHYTETTTFYTESDLTVLRSGLVDVRAAAPADDALDDVCADALPHVTQELGATAGAWPVFAATTPVERALYIACDQLLATDVPGQITLTLHNPSGASARWSSVAGQLEWARFDGTEWVGVSASTGATNNKRAAFALTLSSAGEPTELAGAEAVWLRVRPAAALAADAAWPTLSDVTVSAPRRLADRVPARVMTGAFNLDTDSDFAPFGTLPTFSDTLYLDAAEVLDQPIGARVEFAVTRSPWMPAAQPGDGLVIAVEIRTATAWQAVGYMQNGDTHTVAGTAFQDGTDRLTQTGTIAFDLPALVPEEKHAGKAGRWLRLRIVKGDYGAQGSYDIVDGALVETASTLAPPWLTALALTSESDRVLTASAGDVQLAVTTTGRTRALTLGAAPFVAPEGDRPALWLAFEPGIGGRPISLHIEVLSPPTDLVTGLMPVEADWDPDAPARLEWCLATADGEVELLVDDDTRAFSRPGIVRFLVPADAAATDRFGRTACWICARWIEGTYHHQPRLGRIHHNAVWARAATRITDEVIGAGTGAPGQTARTRHAPVLGGERLEVREARDGAWIPWQAVPDFNGSGPGDRHYQLDFSTGEITFGDGRRGLPPSLGKDNIRLTYETGGGAHNNRSAGAINQLANAVPYVTDVHNPAPAGGGRDAIAPDIAGGEVPRSMRHRGRAVAPADYADLAREASETIARVAVIEPDFRRENPVDFDPDTETTGRGGWVQGVVGSEEASGAAHVGLVEIVVVPHGTEARPTPTQSLIDTVYHALATCAAPGAQIRVTGPRWVTLTVSAELGATAAEAARIVRDANAALDRYLHPLTGGPTNQGWPFGRRPRDSDIQAVLAEVPGVRFVRKLTINCLPLLPLPEFVGVDRDVVLDELTARQAAAALVATGDHALTVVEAR